MACHMSLSIKAITHLESIYTNMSKHLQELKFRTIQNHIIITILKLSINVN
jgi:hypothetical protein